MPKAKHTRIAAVAEAHDVAPTPRCPLGPIVLAADPQPDAACRDAAVQEQSPGIHANGSSDLLDHVTRP